MPIKGDKQNEQQIKITMNGNKRVLNKNFITCFFSNFLEILPTNIKEKA